MFPRMLPLIARTFVLATCLLPTFAAADSVKDPAASDCNPACGWHVKLKDNDKVEDWVNKGPELTPYQYETIRRKVEAGNYAALLCEGDCDGRGSCKQTGTRPCARTPSLKCQICECKK